MPNLNQKVEMSVLLGLTKNVGWQQLVTVHYKRLAELQRDILDVDISKLLSTAELTSHIEKIAEARAIKAVIEYPERRISELQNMETQKGGEDGNLD